MTVLLNNEQTKIKNYLVYEIAGMI